MLGGGLGVTDQCPKELVSLREYFLRISRLILMIIRNIFVFTLALSDLLLTASVPFTVLDALTQVQVFMLNKCNTMFSKYVDLFTTSQSVRKVPKYSSRHSSFSSFLHPAGMASSLFAFRVQVFLIVKHSCCTAILHANRWPKRFFLQYRPWSGTMLPYSREEIFHVKSEFLFYIWGLFSQKRHEYMIKHSSIPFLFIVNLFV